MKMSDLIADFIKQALDASDGVVELQRAQIAQTFGCVPSQVNYVLTSRFSPEMGYIVESRRGGGGYIQIRKASQKDGYKMHVVNSVGNSLDAMSCRMILQNLVHEDVLDKETASLMHAATSDRTYSVVPEVYRDTLRAQILKTMLLNL